MHNLGVRKEEALVARADLDLTIDLHTEGDMFFDILKAVIREWQKAPWPHERERAAYARGIYLRAMEVYRGRLQDARDKAEQGFNTLVDQKLISDMEQKLAYWEKKLGELGNA
ncbi:hypothetical protein SY88_06150 [Clostridiales bacterium PH28_bin88]|nr:hypothetical protein SY88_06150 [Clostridiales bacterium PH28_bin88]